MGMQVVRSVDGMGSTQTNKRGMHARMRTRTHTEHGTGTTYLCTFRRQHKHAPNVKVNVRQMVTDRTIIQMFSGSIIIVFALAFGH